MIEQKLRNLVLGEELDYTLLMSTLSGYRRPRDKITGLLRKGVLVRVKKGLYVFGPEFARRPYSRGILANLIYGPSCVSLQYALSRHGLIPEHAAAVTSVTPKRDKLFDTPAGRFTYRYLRPDRYAVGVTRESVDEQSSFLIATPEKALADLLLLQARRIAPKTPGELRRYLIDDLRCDREALSGLDRGHLREIAAAYKNRKIDLLVSAVENAGGKP